jgi:hypothetical protein
LVETDIEPAGYVGHYLIGYDSSKKLVVDLDTNISGYAIYSGPGWQDRSLVLTSTDTASYSLPKNRFVFTTSSADAFSVDWQTDGRSGWATADHLACRRAEKSGTGDALSANVYLEPRLQPGQKLSNIFSRTISYHAKGVDDLVRRVSGTATYTMTESSPDKLVFDGTFLYDGKPESKGKTEIRDKGRTVCYDGQCTPATDASGLLYNALLWGSPSGIISKGTQWEVTMAEPWELGPAGKQTVTVVAADALTHSVTLKREGRGEGFFANQAKQVHLTKEGKTYTADLIPGQSHWTGYTTFREGVVISDELLVERPVTFASKDLGSISGSERQYILLNAMPSESL